VQDLPLLQGGAEGAVKAVLQVELAAPTDDVGEQVAVERRGVVEERVQPERVLGGGSSAQAPEVRWWGG
jgi:hypothetical protein